ncbi:MAG: DUF3570 domain-containing protein [Thermoanaerobaculia bacterium]|jgi:hypothetical protein
MQLRALASRLLAGALVSVGPALLGQAEPEGRFDADILFSYYSQDGDHSPVTGGIGTEELEVVSPVVVLAWRVDEKMTLTADIGIDQISSASIGNIQMELGGASIPASDTRTFGTFKAKRKFGNQTLGLTLGAASEYDYESFSYGLDWAIDLNQANTGIAAAIRRYDDAIDLIGIDGYGSQGPGVPRTEGKGDRTTTDAVFTLSQTLGRRTAGSLELFMSQQEGVLSTPYHEVILISDSPLYPDGKHVAERLPDSRDRKALGVRLNHGFTDGFVLRTGYRYYEDDWGIASHTIDLETHFRLPTDREMWLYPILRYHTQTGADYFGLPLTFTGAEDYYSSDYDLSEFSSDKYGLGWNLFTLPNESWLRYVDRFEVRGTFYDRDDGLSGFTTSFSFGSTF